MDKRTNGRKVNWDNAADMYSELSFCELEDTREFLDALLVGRFETFLDVCCGAGRASVVAAQMGSDVTGIDNSPRMLEHARENAEAHGVGYKCDFRLLDWNHVLPEQNLMKHDVVFASRCGAIMDVEKLSSLAGRTVGVQIFANAPSIPALLDVLFSGCDERGADGGRPGAGGPGAQGAAGAGPGMPEDAASGPGGFGPAGPGGFGPDRARPDAPGAKDAIYLKIAEKAYRAGYDPNVRIFPERFRKEFASTEEAIAWVAALSPERAEGNLERLALNVAPFLHESKDGVGFCMATKAAIVWWDLA